MAAVLTILILWCPGLACGSRDAVNMRAGYAANAAAGNQLARIRATGIGYPPGHLRGAQARLMAQRAALIKAIKNLSVRLGLGPGAKISGYQVVQTVRLADGGYRVTVEIMVKPRQPVR